MATKARPEPQVTQSPQDCDPQCPGRSADASRVWRVVAAVLTPLASLKLTVALFFLAMCIVLIGTLAQAELDTWQVVNDYFRMDLSSVQEALGTSLAWIDFRVFFPPSFFPNMERIPWGYGFYFPRGWLIGIALFLNLTAAHVIRFRVQSRGRRLLAGLAVLVVGILFGWAVVAAGSEQTSAQLRLFTDWPSLRILWLLTLCTAVSVVLLIACALIFSWRAGTVVLHAGIGLMMVGELAVGTSAIEGQMHIVEGQTVNFVLDTHKLELAIIDTTDPQEDDVAVIPGWRLREAPTLIEDPLLPVDVQVVECQLDPASTAAVRVRLHEKGGQADLGEYQVRMEDWSVGRAVRVPVHGKTYDVFLRYKHMYKPYSLHLIDVVRDVYMGTQTPRSYSSELRLVDPTRHVDRLVRIWMNNPLRFAGETFYQQDYGPVRGTDLEYTGLQVVTNRGWRIPYVSCMMVTVGMFAQFMTSLWRYLRRRGTGLAEGSSGRQPGGGQTSGQDPRVSQGASGAASPTRPVRGRSISGWLIPLAVVVASAVALAVQFRVPARQVGQIDYDAFGRLPVVFEGRAKPLDTLARNSLRIISDREEYRDASGRRQPAIVWLLDVVSDSPAADQHRVFRIQNLELLDTLGLEPRAGYRYCLEELRPHLEAFGRQVRQARMLAPVRRGVFEKKVLELQQRLNHYVALIEAFRPGPLRVEHLREDLAAERTRREEHSGGGLPLVVPPEAPGGDWLPYSFAEFDARAQALAAAQGVQVPAPNPATGAWTKILHAYSTKASDAAAFNHSVQEYWKLLRAHPPQDWSAAKTDFEADFNRLAPFNHALVLYIGAFFLGCFSWLGWDVPLRRAATWLTLFALVVHTLALAARIYISGRPPVTGLYSSALFVGWAGVVLAIILEFYSRVGVANVVGAFLGFATLLISVLLTTAVPSFKGDSFTVLVAVLDTQFWLALHVTVITAGYSATFLAGLLGIVYVLRGTLTPSLVPELARDTSRMIYGTVCFAIFFSFFGTVLGGLWADDSWGRFWGWDPKENGALIIVLWNALVLHAYWGRMVRERGLAVLSIVGNVVTAWSWFGVNELGVGLHTYGFTEGVLLVLATVVAAHGLILALGLLPLSHWRSRVQPT